MPTRVTVNPPIDHGDVDVWGPKANIDTLALAAAVNGLGNAADLNVGTVAGTVAAGDQVAAAKARGNHTGTQVASTISDFSEAVDDRVAVLIVPGSGISSTYNDSAGTLTLTASGGGTSLFVNVSSFSGYDGTAATDSDAAFTSANAAVAIGGVIYVPGDTVRLAATYNIPEGVTLRGAMGHRYQKYYTAHPGTNATYIKPHSGAFTGTALVSTTDKWGWKIENINLDGVNYSTLDGLLVNGASKGWRLRSMSVKGFGGVGVHTDATSSGYPNGFEVHQVFINSCGSHGWYSGNSIARNYPVGDCQISMSESSVNDGDGWRFDGCNNFAMDDCKSEFNGGNGYRFYGSVLRTEIKGCSTDRNLLNGFWVDSPIQSGSAAGNQIVFVGCSAARDGCTSSSDSASPAGSAPYSGGYAGFRFECSNGTSNSVRGALVGCATRVGRNDTGAGVMSPDYGVYVARGTCVLIDGCYIYGTTAPTYDPLLSIRAGFANQFNQVDPTSFALTQDVGAPSIYSIWAGSTLRITDGASPPSNTLSAKVHIQRTTDAVALGLVNTNAGNSSPMLSAQAGTATSAVLGTTIPADSFSRWMLKVNGQVEWGSGSAARDTILTRSAAGFLAVGGETLAAQTIAYKAADTARTSTTTLNADPDLVVAVAASETYALEGLLIYDGDPAADFKFSLTLPTGATVNWGALAIVTSATVSTGGHDTSAYTLTSPASVSIGTAGAGTLLTAHLKGIVTVSTTSGSLGLKWSQLVSSATATTLRAGSHLKLTRLA